MSTRPTRPIRPDAVSSGASVPLLKGPVCFPLRAGLSHLPRVRRLVRFGLLLLGLWITAWATALWHEFLLWGMPWWHLALATLICLGCLRRLQNLWRQASAPGEPFMLDWMGPLPGRDAAASDAPTGGWHLRAWEQLVDVRCLLDTQHAVVLRVGSVPGSPVPRSAHVVVADAPDRLPGMGARELHRLRALLTLPPAMTRHRVASNTPDASVQPAIWLPSMASWAFKALSWGLRSHPTMTQQTRRNARQYQGEHAMAAHEKQIDTSFAPTEILSDRRSV